MIILVSQSALCWKTKTSINGLNPCDFKKTLLFTSLYTIDKIEKPPEQEVGLCRKSLADDREVGGGLQRVLEDVERPVSEPVPGKNSAPLSFRPTTITNCQLSLIQPHSCFSNQTS